MAAKKDNGEPLGVVLLEQAQVDFPLVSDDLSRY